MGLATQPESEWKDEAYVKDCPTPEQVGLLGRHDGQLQHHANETVSTQLLGDAAHDQLVEDSAHQEGDKHGNGFREVGAGWEVDMAEEEVVNRDVPFAGELKPMMLSKKENVFNRANLPVARVPPVRIEVSVRKPSQFCKRAQNVFEDNQEHQQEGDHEGEQKHANSLSQDKRLVNHVGHHFELRMSFVKNGNDVFLACQCQQEDTTEYGHGLICDL